jgi:hypothetical protein
VVALYGAPAALEQRISVDVSVTAEPIEGADHTIHFNRGSAATQEYAADFRASASEVGQAAYDWLPRGLIEGSSALSGARKRRLL